MASSRYERIWKHVRRIPRGRVATYGQIARLAGIPRGARQVGYALHALPDATSVPWHRVINARGSISVRLGGASVTQLLRLEREGVRFDAGGRTYLARYQWRPRRRARSRQLGR
ncbi:MAG TPA: methylated-DNA--[protein]-cysteine S-methyltransferase [Candidatus Eisenbacteria bacterium]|nr:methylated-DNA--[protein]-cysteine S-methyltransferase [Candidatus Eisenbacteria bacterium]